MRCSPNSRAHWRYHWHYTETDTANFLKPAYGPVRKSSTTSESAYRELHTIGAQHRLLKLTSFETSQTLTGTTGVSEGLAFMKLQPERSWVLATNWFDWRRNEPRDAVFLLGAGVLSFVSPTNGSFLLRLRNHSAHRLGQICVSSMALATAARREDAVGAF